MGALDRISQIGGQISGDRTAGGRDKILEKRPDDVRSPPSRTLPCTR
jgi:acetyl-CoA acyltransferase 1